MPRPPIQHHKHIIELGPHLEEALENGSIRDLVVMHEAGQAAKGFLSTNVGAIASVGAIVATLLAYKPTRDLGIRYMTFLKDQFGDFAFSWFEHGAEATADQIAEKLKEAGELVETALEKFRKEEQEIAFGAAGPVGIPLDPALSEFLRTKRKAEEGL